MVRRNSSKSKKSPVNKVKIKRGPKGFWGENVLEQVFVLARFGMTNKEIAEVFKLSLGTIENWQRTKPGFDKALQEGRLISSMKVVDFLYKRACGYYYDEIHEEHRVNKSGVQVLVSRKVITRHVLPNIIAGIYLLKVRHPDKWEHIQKTELSGDFNINIKPVDLTDVPTKELELLERMGMKRLMEHGSRSN